MLTKQEALNRLQESLVILQDESILNNKEEGKQSNMTIMDDTRFVDATEELIELLQGKRNKVAIHIKDSEISRTKYQLIDQLRFVRKVCGRSEKFSWKEWVSFFKWVLDLHIKNYEIVREMRWEVVVGVLCKYDDFKFDTTGNLLVVSLKN